MNGNISAISSDNPILMKLTSFKHKLQRYELLFDSKNNSLMRRCATDDKWKQIENMSNNNRPK